MTAALTVHLKAADGATSTLTVPMPAITAPAKSGVIWSLDWATNAGTFMVPNAAGQMIPGTLAQLYPLVVQVYRGKAGPFTKFYDDNKGIRATISSILDSGYLGAGEQSPYVCYRPQATDADLQFAFNWLVTNFPNQEIWLCHDQEPENKSLTASQYIAKTQQEFRVRATNPAWVKWIKLWPCLMGYQEVDAANPTLNWRTLVQPTVDLIDGVTWDIYDEPSDKSGWTPATYIGPMFTAAQALGKPCGLGEWATTLSIKGGDTEQLRAARTQAVIDYCNARAYDPVTRPWGIRRAGYWENYKGTGAAGAQPTGLVAAALAGNAPPTLGVLLAAMGRS